MNKISTKQKLINSAIDLFSNRCYSDVSVANICRNAGVSNGIFYKYFKNKEQLFRNLVENFLEILNLKLNSIDLTSTIDQRVGRLINIIFDLTVTHSKRLIIFREGQYRFPEYEKQLKGIFRNTANNVFGRKLSGPELQFVISGLRFIAYRWQYNNTPIDKETVKKIILHGVFTRPIEKEDKIFNIEAVPLNVKMDEETKERLLKSGRILFGKKDYYNVNIYQITQESNLSIGTFYKYFDSKLSFFCQIIDSINRDIRKFISKNLDHTLNRLEIELQGIYLFLLYLTIDPSCYPVVREAEFIANNMAKEYYDVFENRYMQNLTDIKDLDKRTVCNYLIGISHYLGIDVLFYQNIKVIKNFLMELSHYLVNGMTGKLN